MQTDNSPADDQRQWQAYRYLTGALTDQEAEQFELQMLEDADLCALVADTSLLTSAIAAAGHPDSPPPAPLPVQTTARHGITRVTAVASVICCSAVGILFALQNGTGFRSADPEMADMTDADFLVTVWADSIEAEPEPESLAAEPSDDAELDIPAWMLAGIAGTESTSPTSGDAASPETDSPELL